jgi:hypothetical protein
MAGVFSLQAECRKPAMNLLLSSLVIRRIDQVLTLCHYLERCPNSRERTLPIIRREKGVPDAAVFGTVAHSNEALATGECFLPLLQALVTLNHFLTPQSAISLELDPGSRARLHRADKSDALAVGNMRRNCRLKKRTWREARS